MLPTNFHTSDRDLLLFADGELPSRRAAEVRRHLGACWTCRARMAELEHTITNFVQLHQRDLQLTVPPIDNPRALLKARMAGRGASSGSEKGAWFRGMPQRTAGVLAAAVLLIGVIGGVRQYRNLEQGSKRSELAAVPDVALTPGMAKAITPQEACSARFLTNDPEVPDSLRREVLKKYGVSVAASTAYQIDYLVTPRLGGTANVRNLWPQPSSTVWNASVKDELEDRLRDLVCSGKLDLSTAQREISQNWVAAYKKYFHTNEPLTAHLRG